jgi:hypothetical protein
MKYLATKQLERYPFITLKETLPVSKNGLVYNQEAKKTKV